MATKKSGFSKLPSDAKKAAFANMSGEGHLYQTSKRTGKRSSKAGIVPKKRVAKKSAMKKTSKKRK